MAESRLVKVRKAKEKARYRPSEERAPPRDEELPMMGTEL
jgi:hypothetical protein